jgi:hypothetical protein
MAVPRRGGLIESSESSESSGVERRGKRRWHRNGAWICEKQRGSDGSEQGVQVYVQKCRFIHLLGVGNLLVGIR